MAMDSLGEAWVDVHARVEDFDSDLDKGLKRELKEADSVVDDAGKELGETLSKSMEKEVGKHGKTLGKTVTKSVEDAIKDEDLDFAPKLRYNRRGKNGRFISRVASEIEEDIGSAFASQAGGGFFKFISQGVADAIGAGFNVSGKSPLIGALIPAVGAIVGLVVGAIQAVNSLIAVLATVPALIGAIGLQVGVLFAAFKGVGTAIQGAFAAKNAKELNEAIKELTPAAQTFVKSLLPLKDLWTQLSKGAQNSFFLALGNVIPQIQKALGSTLVNSFIRIASSLGGLFRNVALFFAGSAFKTFLEKIVPSTVKFLDGFGPKFVAFLSGLINFASATIPFLDRLGNLIGTQLQHLGEAFDRIASNPATQKWFDDMFITLKSVVELINVLTEFVVNLLATLNDAGGQKVLDEIVKDIQMISDFIGSDFGQKAFEGLIHVVIGALKVTTGLILAFLILLGLFEITAEFIKNALLPAIGDFFVMVWHALDVAGNAIREFVFMLGRWFADVGVAIWNALDVAGQAVRSFVFAVGAWFAWLGTAIWAWGTSVRDAIREVVDFTGRAFMELVNAVVGFFVRLWNSLNDGKGKLLLSVAALPGQIRNALGDLGGLLWNAGKSLVQGLINGIRGMFGALWQTGKDMIGYITAWLPGSPAEVGPLSGRGYSKLRGQRMVADFAAGIQAEMPSLNSTSSDLVNNIMFGPNSIRVGFEGVTPTQQQATATGNGVANGIMGGLLARNTRLAVRTI